MSEAHRREVVEAKTRPMREKGDDYPVWVLDRLGVETMLGNRVAKGRGLTAPRFRWVTYDDALVLPLDTASERRVNPDYAAFYPPEERLLARYLSDLKLSAIPTTLREYLSQVVSPTLERQKSGGALAVKFEAAYLRALDFAEANESEAARVYARYARGTGQPSIAEYKPLQDFLFRYVAREAGRLGLAVHTIRRWLEFAPEKVLFGTDAFALTPEVGWEEVGWLSARTGRETLAIALTGMLRDGEITRGRASELARMVLRENAARLYEIQPSQ